MSQSILISACLLGEKVRYDANHLLLEDKIIKRWIKMGILIPICPEVAGGLSIPRPPAEILSSDDRPLKVITSETQDVTNAFSTGASIALKTCHQHKIQMAVLTEGSPSCGSSKINDGSFSKTKIAGEGVTTKLLRKNNIKVFNQYQLQQANQCHQQLVASQEED